MNQINSVQTVLEQARHLSEAGEVERAGQLRAGAAEILLIGTTLSSGTIISAMPSISVS